MEVFVQRALKKIKKETSRKHKALRESCNDVLGMPGSVLPPLNQKNLKLLPVLFVAEQINANVAKGDSQDSDADKYFLPFKLACESKHARIMEVCIASIERERERGGATCTHTSRARAYYMRSHAPPRVHSGKAVSQKGKCSNVSPPCTPSSHSLAHSLLCSFAFTFIHCTPPPSVPCSLFPAPLFFPRPPLTASRS
jgi:hypothetical protein